MTVKIRRLTVVGLSLLTTLTFSIAGCTDSSNDTGGANDSAGAESAPDDPAGQLAKAANKISETSFKVKMEIGTNGSMSGTVDAAKNLGLLKMKVSESGSTVEIDMRMIDTDMYMKMDFGLDLSGVDLPGMEGLDGSKWMHMDVSKLPKDNSLGLSKDNYDPAGAAEFLKAVSEVSRVDDRTLTGTIDLTKTVGAAGLSSKSLASLDPQSAKVPFRATVDAEGRLNVLTIDMPALDGDPAQKLTTTYSDYGTKVTVAKPAANEIKEMPSSIFKTFTE